MSMYTDPNHIKIDDPGQIEGNTVFIYLDAFCTDEHFSKYLPEYKNLDEFKAHYERGGLGDVKIKKYLFNVLEEILTPIRERRKIYENKINDVYNILEQGSLKARAKASITLKEVKDAMKINYFDDKELIKSHIEKYKTKGE